MKLSRLSKFLTNIKSQSELLPIVLIIIILLSVTLVWAYQNTTELLNESSTEETNSSSMAESGITLNETTQILENNETTTEILQNDTSSQVEYITDNSPPIYSNFGINNTHPKKDEAVEFYAFWEDDFGLDIWIFSWNASGSWENETHSFISSYDEKTQILTRKGWKYLKDVNYEDEIATLSGKNIEWEKPVRIISLPYDNGIYEVNGEINLFITPNHQVYARVDNTLSFLLNKIKDFFFGIDVEDFKFIEIEEAYKLTKDGYYLTFLDDKLKPVYVNKITKENYKGWIYDLTVPNHIVLVKRFGKAVWSSNLNVKESWSNVTKVIPVTGVIGYKFYASDLAGNWKETDDDIIEVKESNITHPVEVSNQTLLTVRTDKLTYAQNETVNVSGEFLINGTRERDIDLIVLFNQTPQHSKKIKAMNGSYFYSFIADFKQEGEYLVKASVENLTNSTSFYYFLNTSELRKLSVEIFYPEKITRGEAINVKVNVTNTNSVEVKNVLLTWKLPEGFEIVSGSQTKNCGTLEPNAFCTSTITVQTSLSTQLGINEIKVVVSYE